MGTPHALAHTCPVHENQLNMARLSDFGVALEWPWATRPMAKRGTHSQSRARRGRPLARATERIFFWGSPREHGSDHRLPRAGKAELRRLGRGARAVGLPQPGASAHTADEPDLEPRPSGSAFRLRRVLWQETRVRVSRLTRGDAARIVRCDSRWLAGARARERAGLATNSGYSRALRRGSAISTSTQRIRALTCA